MRYRKMPLEIEAVQFDGSNEEAIKALAGDKFWLVGSEDRGDDPDIEAEVFDVLHSTWVGVKRGQWVIRGIQGEFYPCNPDVFAQTYEPVP